MEKAIKSDLIQKLIIKAKKRFKRSKNILLPKLNQKLAELEKVLPEKNFEKNYSPVKLTELKSSISATETHQSMIYNDINNAKNNKDYEQAFNRVIKEIKNTFIVYDSDFDDSNSVQIGTNTTKTKDRYMADLLKLIWTVYVDYNDEAKYNAFMKEMEADLSRAKGKAMIEERKRRGEKAREETQRKEISIGQQRKTPSPNGKNNATSQNKLPPEHLPPEVLEATKPSSKDSNTTSQNKPRSNVERLKRFFEGQSRSR